jgi:hypothetical protein
MSTIQTTYKGKPAYRGSLMTRGNKRVDDFFVLRDTLLCYSSTDLAPLYFRKGAREGKRVDDFFVLRDTLLCYSGTDLAPLYFRKGAREGKRYTVDEVFYNYAGGNCNVNLHYQNKHGEHRWKKHSYDDCVFDMMNIFLRARSFDPANWKKGHSVKFPICDGGGRTPAQLKYGGKVTVKADNGIKYRCLRLEYQEYEDEKWKKIVDFYITDDENHIPVRLDMFLKFGSAKAFLVNAKGTRNPITSIVK